MKQMILPLIFTGLILTASCIYTNSGIYNAEPVPGAPAEITLETNLDTLAPVSVSDSLQVYYQLTIEGGTVYYLQGILDELLLYDIFPEYDPDTVSGPYTLSDSFWIRRSVPLPRGTYLFSMVTYYSANTNSLGDLAGLEREVDIREYTVELEGGDP